MVVELCLSGLPKEIIKQKKSLTGRYLAQYVKGGLKNVNKGIRKKIIYHFNA